MLNSTRGPAGQRAASLREAVGRKIDRNAFAARLLTLLDEWFEIYCSSGPTVILQAWRAAGSRCGRASNVSRGEPSG